MDVPLELPGPFVLGGHDPAPGFPQLLDEPDVSKHQAGLRRQVADQPVLRWVHRIVGRGRDGERPEQFTPVTNLDRRVPLQDREFVPRKPYRRRGLAVRLDSCRPQLGPNPEPHDRSSGAHRAGEDPGHLGQHVLGPIRIPKPGGELREHLVRRGPATVDQPVGDPPGQTEGRPEREPDGGGGHDGPGLAPPGDRTDRQGHDQEDGGQQHGDDPVQHGLLHDQVKVVQPVLEDRHAHCGGKPDPDEGEDDQEKDGAPDRAAEGRSHDQPGHDGHDGKRHDGGGHVEEPADLLALLLAGTPVPKHERDHRKDRAEENDEAADGEDGAGHGLQGMHPERIHDRDPHRGVLKDAGRQRVRQDEQPSERGDRTREVSPPRAGDLARGIEQHQEDDRRDGRHPERTGAHHGGTPERQSARVRLERVGGVLVRQAAEDEGESDPHHQPPHRVPGVPRGEERPDSRVPDDHGEGKRDEDGVVGDTVVEDGQRDRHTHQEDDRDPHGQRGPSANGRRHRVSARRRRRPRSFMRSQASGHVRILRVRTAAVQGAATIQVGDDHARALGCSPP